MKVCTIQPHYSFNESNLQKCFNELLSLMDKCDESMDIIVLPEYSDVLADAKSKANFDKAVETYTLKNLQAKPHLNIENNLCFCTVNNGLIRKQRINV